MQQQAAWPSPSHSAVALGREAAPLTPAFRLLAASSQVQESLERATAEAMRVADAPLVDGSDSERDEEEEDDDDGHDPRPALDSFVELKMESGSWRAAQVGVCPHCLLTRAARLPRAPTPPPP